MTQSSVARGCDVATELGVASVLAVLAFRGAALTFWTSLILFAFLCFLALDAWRPRPRRVALGVALAATSFAGVFGLRFALAFPLTVEPSVLALRLVSSLLHPLPLICGVAIASAALYAVFRASVDRDADGGDGAVAALYVLAGLCVYWLSLPFALPLDVAGAELSLPAVSVLLALAAIAWACRLAIAGDVEPGTSQPALAARWGVPGLQYALAAALGLLALHGVALWLLLRAIYGVPAELPWALAGSLAGLALFGAMLNAQLALPGPARRLRWVLAAALAVAVLSVWWRVELLPEIRPGFRLDA